MKSIIAIFIGAGLGALLPGTLAANLIGGYIIGVAELATAGHLERSRGQIADRIAPLHESKRTTQP